MAHFCTWMAWSDTISLLSVTLSAYQASSTPTGLRVDGTDVPL